MKNKMELTIGVCVGSSIVRAFIDAGSNIYRGDWLTWILQQLATFVVPLLVIVGWMYVLHRSIIFDLFGLLISPLVIKSNI